VDIIELIGYFVMGYLMHQLITAWFWYRRFKMALNDAEKDGTIQQAIDAKIKTVRLEKVEQSGGSVVLVYDADNNFITQGMDTVEATDMLKQKYPSHTVIILSNPEIDHKSK
jgi:tetrahydromethanopterin S-methyltransferase subunit H